MQPDSQQNQLPSSGPVTSQWVESSHLAQQASLPAMPVAPGAPQAASSLPPPSSAIELRTVDQAKQLVKQYGNDPYRLSEAFIQLKSKFLSDQFHITPDSAGER